MSKKTLRKRIAVAAVSALGAGLLSVVSIPTANATNNTTAITVNDVRINTQTAGTNLAAGVCAIDSVASSQVLGALGTGSTATTIAVGAKLQFVTGTNGLGSLVISGPATWAGQPVSTSDLTGLASQATVSSDLKTVGFADNAASAILVATGVGAVTVSAYNAATPAAATALVGIDQAGISSTGVAATKGSSAQTVSVFVSQDTTTNPGKALTTTVTVTANGTVIGTKTITILGLPSSIEVPQANVTIGTATSATTTTNAFKFIVKDNAGNRLEIAPAATGAIGGTSYNPASGVSAVTTAGAYATSYRSPLDNSGNGDGKGTFTCSATVSGSQSVTIGFYNAALALVKSNPFTVNCSVGGINTFTVSTAAATSADAFDQGIRTYKFRVDQAEGSFVGQAQPTATTDDAAKTVAYTIKSATATVTNAEVLKSIVSLIASINKQIQALQKLILKR